MCMVQAHGYMHKKPVTGNYLPVTGFLLEGSYVNETLKS